MEKVFLLIERYFYVRNNTLVQTGDNFTVFKDWVDASDARDEMRALEKRIFEGTQEEYDAVLNKFIITKPNGSKIELQLVNCSVR